MCNGLKNNLQRFKYVQLAKTFAMHLTLQSIKKWIVMIDLQA